jgi:HNH endonuclease
VEATPEDPLALGQRVVSVLETGARTATYKLATLMALVDHCVEHLPARPADPLAVPVRDLAMRVIELYWPQGSQVREQATASVHPAGREDSRRGQGSPGRDGAGDTGMSFAVASVRAPRELERTLDVVALTMVRQPLHRLQKLPNGSGDPFLFDDSWMHDAVSRRTLAQHGDEIVLFDGVPSGLARLSGLLRPALELLWVEDVRRMNKWLGENVPDVAGHLFGRDRISMAPARDALTEAFGPRCFYCDRRLSASSPVDHVLPWSRVGIDGLANLVLACPSCNGDKLHSLPALPLVDRALGRDRVVLEQIAERIEWPTQYERVISAARGLYLGQPQGSPTWAGLRKSVRLDLSFAVQWLESGG